MTHTLSARNRQIRDPRHRRGQTMLELVAATTIISVALVPALKMTRKSVSNMNSLENAEDCVALCVSKLESELAFTASTWNLANRAGDFTDQGQPNMRFSVAKSDAASEGGIVNSLATINVTVWYDENLNRTLDDGEQQTRLSTKLAKVLSYEYESTIH